MYDGDEVQSKHANNDEDNHDNDGGLSNQQKKIIEQAMHVVFTDELYEAILQFYSELERHNDSLLANGG